MNNNERLARKAAIVSLLACYPSLADRITEDHITAYVLATAELPVAALKAACEDFMRGEVPGHNPAFAPTGPELTARTALRKVAADRLARLATGTTASDGLVSYPIGGKPPEGYVPLGPVKADLGSGMIDMSKMSHAEKEAVLGPKPVDGVPAPRLRRMSDQ